VPCGVLKVKGRPSARHKLPDHAVLGTAGFKDASNELTQVLARDLRVGRIGYAATPKGSLPPASAPCSVARGAVAHPSDATRMHSATENCYVWQQ
jgi:hypothetical protein